MAEKSLPTSLIRNRAPLGSYSRTMPRALWWPYGGLLFLMSEVSLYREGVGGDGGHLHILVCLVIHDSGKVSLEHLLLSWYPFHVEPT